MFSRNQVTSTAQPYQTNMEPCGVLKSFQAGVINISDITSEKFTLFQIFEQIGRVISKLFSIDLYHRTVKLGRGTLNHEFSTHYKMCYLIPLHKTYDEPS